MATLADDQLLAGGLLIGSDWVHETSAGSMEHVNPATGKTQAHFPIAGASEVDAAIEQARVALPGWRRMPAAERQAILHRIAALLREHGEMFSRVTTLENGTPMMMTGMQSTIAATWFDYYAGWVDKVTGQVHPVDGSFNYTVPEPYGVVAIVLTWNGPTGSIGMKVAAALAAGCTVILKPPELAPFSSSLFGQLALDGGLPPGVLNVLAGGPEASEQLVRHPDVDKISFTGSPSTAARIQAACADSLTPLVLELGGKSANIVLADADIASVSASAAMGIAALSGQVCVAPTRLIVQSSVHDQVLEGVVGTLQALKVGDPFDPTSFVGPLISSSARDRVIGIADRARQEGSGDLVTGGEALGGDLADGFYVAPTVFTNVDNRSALAQEEAFGPVLAVIQIDDVDEAVAIANDSKFGLAAYVHTRDLATALKVASALDVGNVAINGGSPVAGPVAPFGGFKDSGYGKEGGLEGLMEFVRVKNVNVGLPASA